MFHMSVEPVSYFKNIYTKPSVKKAWLLITPMKPMVFTHDSWGVLEMKAIWVKTDLKKLIHVEKKICCIVAH